MILLIKSASPIMVIFILLSACQGNREMVHTFGYYDKNQDYDVDREEFNSVFANEGDFDNWNIDSDRHLTEDEWNKGFNNYGSRYPYEERGLFDDWDTDRDTYVNRDEFSEGFFNILDADDNGFINQDEWDKYSEE